jgi:hypothetical protein
MALSPRLPAAMIRDSREDEPCMPGHGARPAIRRRFCHDRGEGAPARRSAGLARARIACREDHDLNTHATFRALAGALLLSALAMQPADAVNVQRYIHDQGGAACQLSLPTISSKVRPRASGMRNEGASTEFVICQYPGVADFSAVDMSFESIDGAVHDIQCTAVDGDAQVGLVYAPKTVSTDEEGGRALLAWLPADFGWGNSPMLYFQDFSVTCSLPPGTAITHLSAAYTEDVGA